MITFQKTLKNNFLLFFFAATCIYLALYFVSVRSETNIGSEGYFTLIENASLPILLTDQRQQFNLQIGALIQNTPVTQIRIFDTQGELLFRVQNTASGDNTNGSTTLRKPLLFEGTAAAILELDIQSNQREKINTWPNELWLAIIAGISALTIVATAIFLQRKLAQSDTYGVNDGDDASPETEITPALRNHLTSSAHLILVARVLFPTDRSDASGDSLTEYLNELCKTICGMAKIYGAKPMSISANTLVFVIEGPINKQLTRQATMLCWGITQLTEENTQHKGLKPSIQSYIVSPTNLKTQPKQSLAYWTELDVFCSSDHATEAYISEPINNKLDRVSFNLAAEKNQLLRIVSVSDTIKKLWRNQRLQLDKKNEH